MVSETQSTGDLSPLEKVEHNLVQLIYFTILLIFFPIYIQLFGRDAFTTGTVFVFVLFFILVIRSVILKNKINYIFLTFFIIIISIISAFSIDKIFLDKSLRSLVQFVSAILLFIVIFNTYKKISSEVVFQEIERLMFFIVLMISIQIVIGCFLYYIPGFEDCLSFFSTRNKDALLTKFDGGTLRLQTLIVGGEAIGECIAVFFPFVLYYLYFSDSLIKYIFLIIFILGLALAVTRSAVILIIFSGIFFYWRVIFKTKILATLKGLYVAVLLFIVCIFFFDKIFEDLIFRFSNSLSEFHRTGSIISAINRDGVWFYIETVVWPNLSIFGNGMITIVGNKPFHIHSLYITLIHQFGVLGFIVFLYFFTHLFIKILTSYYLCQEGKLKVFLFCSLLSFICLLVNEIKFEFNRYDSYQKIIWVLFAVIALSTQIRKANCQP